MVEPGDAPVEGGGTGPGARPDGPSVDVGSNPSRGQRLKVRLLAVEAKLNGLTKSKTARRWLLPIGVLIFLVVSVLSFGSLSNGVQMNWWAVVVVLFLTPVMVLINAGEFRVIGEINRHRIGWMSASRLTVFATAANLLPLPGGVLIRTQALRVRGSSYRHALLANAAAMVAWVGVGALVVGALFMPNANYRIIAVILLVFGVGSVFGCWWMLRGLKLPRLNGILGRLLLVEGLKVALGGVRISFAFLMIGYSATPAQAVALTAANILAAAIGIFPSGLGLREGIAGLIGAAMSLQLSVSVATTAADRIVSQLGLVLVVGLLLVADKVRRRPHVPPPEEIVGGELPGSAV